MAGALKQKRKFLTLNGVFKRQSAFGTALADGDLNVRHNAEISIEEVVEAEAVLDCDGDDLVDEILNSRLKRFRITYSAVTPQIIAGWLALVLGGSASPTGTPANESQTVTVDATGGTFTLSFEFEGKTSTSSPIAYNATPSAVESALWAMPSIGNENVTATGTLAGGLTITFEGELAKANLPLLTSTATSLTGGAGTAIVSAGANGTNKVHALTRSTSDDLPKTTIGVGFKDDGANPVKYKNLTVEEVSIQVNKRKPVTMEVVAVGSFTEAEMSAYTLPDCQNITGLRGADCRLKINADFYNETLWSASIRIVNNIPTGDDAFPFDSIDASNFERGDNPTYPISLQILGSRGDAIHTLASERSLADVFLILGKPVERVSINCPNTKLVFASTPEIFVGELRRSAVSIEAVPYKDDVLGTPISATANLAQTEQFIAT